jgi:hypothetical protein
MSRPTAPANAAGMSSPNAPTFGGTFMMLYELRAVIERTLEEMIDLLDAWDGDSDLELTSVETCGRGFIDTGADDAEDTHDAEMDHAELGIADLDGLIEQRPGAFHGSAI